MPIIRSTRPWQTRYDAFLNQLIESANLTPEIARCVQEYSQALLTEGSHNGSTALARLIDTKRISQQNQRFNWMLSKCWPDEILLCTAIQTACASMGIQFYIIHDVWTKKRGGNVAGSFRYERPRKKALHTGNYQRSSALVAVGNGTSFPVSWKLTHNGNDLAQATLAGIDQNISWGIPHAPIILPDCVCDPRVKENEGNRLLVESQYHDPYGTAFSAAMLTGMRSRGLPFIIAVDGTSMVDVDGEQKSVESIVGTGSNEDGEVGEFQAGPILSGPEWIVTERHSDFVTNYFVTNLPSETPLDAISAMIRMARDGIKPELDTLRKDIGLDLYRGVDPTGFRRHSTLCMVASAFLAMECANGTPPPTKLFRVPNR